MNNLNIYKVSGLVGVGYTGRVNYCLLVLQTWLTLVL